MPEGKPADDGKVLKRTATGPKWETATPTEVGSPYSYTLDDTNWADTGLSIPEGKEWLLLSLQDFQERRRSAAIGDITAYSTEVFVRIADLLSAAYSTDDDRKSGNSYRGVSVNFAGAADSNAGDLHFGATSTRNLLIAIHEQ